MYATGADVENSMKLFDDNFDNLPEKAQAMMSKRARALMKKKYRTTWNAKKTQETLQVKFWVESLIIDHEHVLCREAPI